MSQKMNILRKCYDSAASFYGRGNDLFWKKRFDWLRKTIKNTLEITEIPVEPNASILDLGCGTGIASEEFFKLYPQTEEIVGIDLSPKMGEEAKKILGDKFIFYEGDYTNGSLWQTMSKKFQGVLAFYTFHWIPLNNYSAITQHIHKILKDRGWVIGIAMGQKELGGIFDDMIAELLQIYLPPKQVSKILSQWNPKNVSEIEEAFKKSGFSYSRITSLRYSISVQRYKDLISMILYQYNFWLAGLDPTLFPLVREKLMQFVKNDARFLEKDGKIQVPHHLIVFEAHKA